jgi:hypothetical protein
MTIRISNRAYTLDTTRGFDIMRGKTVLDHAPSYEAARRLCAQYKGAYIRYWVAEKKS